MAERPSVGADAQKRSDPLTTEKLHQLDDRVQASVAHYPAWTPQSTANPVKEIDHDHHEILSVA